jgi:hypothetical protein
MAFIILDKESNKFRLFGSLPLMCSEFELDKSNLEYHFSRKKELEFENEKYQITKVVLERGGSPK